MRITPLDVRKQEFKKVVRGLDPEEVYAFLATVADEYETVLTDNRQIRDRVLELDEKVTEYRNMEKTLRDTLMTAERVMAEARENARKEADLLLRDAKVQAQQDSQNTAAQAEALKAQLRELRSQRDAFLARLRGLAEAQIGMVASFAKDFEEDDRQQDRSTYHNYQATGATPQSTPQTFDTVPAPSSWSPAESLEQPEDYADEVLPPTNHLSHDYRAQEAVDPDGPTRGYNPNETVDHWRAYSTGSEEHEDAPAYGEYEGMTAPVIQPPLATPMEALAPSVDELAQSVAEMVEAAGAQSGQLDQSVPSSPGSDGDYAYAPAPGQPEEESAAVASAEESDESREGSRWSISRFTRGLGDF